MPALGPAYACCMHAPPPLTSTACTRFVTCPARRRQGAFCLLAKERFACRPCLFIPWVRCTPASVSSFCAIPEGRCPPLPLLLFAHKLPARSPVPQDRPRQALQSSRSRGAGGALSRCHKKGNSLVEFGRQRRAGTNMESAAASAASTTGHNVDCSRRPGETQGGAVQRVQ